MKKPRRVSSVAVMISVLLHVGAALYVATQIAKEIVREIAEPNLSVEWVTIPDTPVRRISPRKSQPRQPLPPTAPVNDVPVAAASSNMIPEVVIRTTQALEQTVRVSPHETVEFEPEITTNTDLAATDVSPTSRLTSTPGATRVGRGVETGRAVAAGARPDRQGLSVLDSIGAANLGMDGAKFTDLTNLLPDNKLGAVLRGEGRDVSGHIRLLRVKHSLSDWWQDPTAMASLIEWLDEHTRIRADMKFEGGALPLTDQRFLDSPMLIMTGHDKDITVSRNMTRGGPLTSGFTDVERANLRQYLIDRQGLLFFDDCGFNGLFAEQIKNEIGKILPEYDLVDIPHAHEIYTIYYELAGPPDGGDVFWGSENRAQVSKFRYQKGVFINDRLAVVYNRKDYMCAMETAEIESRTLLRLRRSPDVYRFMTNLFVYAMKYGGNVDRSAYAAY